MGSHHDHPVTETKPVSFRTPLILALVTVLLILLAVSTCDGQHGACECKENCSEECMKKCEHGDHSGHNAAKEEHHHAAKTEEHHDVEAPTTVAADTTKAESVPAHH